jgi:hypothetical protein
MRLAGRDGQIHMVVRKQIPEALDDLPGFDEGRGGWRRHLRARIPVGG